MRPGLLHRRIPQAIGLLAALCVASLAQGQGGAGGESGAAGQGAAMSAPKAVPGPAGTGAFGPAGDPLPDFPAGSIRSPEQVPKALAAAGAARTRQATRYAAQRKACYQEFLAERCLSAAREEDNRATRRITGLELEASGFQRRYDAQVHARELAERQAKQRDSAAAERAEREKKSAGQASKVERNARQKSEFEAEAATRAKRAAEANKRDQERRAALAKKQADERAAAPERAERAREREKDVEDVLKRAREREAKAAEKKQAKAANPSPLKKPELPGAGEGKAVIAPEPQAARPGEAQVRP